MVKLTKILLFIVAILTCIGAGLFAYVDWGTDIYPRTIGVSMFMLVTGIGFALYGHNLGCDRPGDPIYDFKKNGLWLELLGYTLMVLIIVLCFWGIYQF